MELPEIPPLLRSYYTDAQLTAFDSSVRCINDILNEPSLLDPLQEEARLAFVDVCINRVLTSMSLITPSAPPAYDEIDIRAAGDLPAYSTVNIGDVRKQGFHRSLGRVLRAFSRRRAEVAMTRPRRVYGRERTGRAM